MEITKEEFIKWCDGKYDLKNPKTIQDKIQWLKLYDVTSLKTFCADKIKVHEYCKEKLGKDICVPIIKVFDDNKINLAELPNKFTLKCNHGSGMNIIVNDKSKTDKNDAMKKLSNWIKTDFSMQNHYEYHYHDIERKIFAEEFLEDKNQQKSLFDYKFWCFSGEPKMYTINSGHGHGDILYFDMNDNVLNFYNINYNINNFKKPSQFELMKEYAEKLSEDFKFVRVDFYEVNGKVYLGELTFTPGSGIFSYTKKEDEIFVGDMLNLNK